MVGECILKFYCPLIKQDLWLRLFAMTVSTLLTKTFPDLQSCPPGNRVESEYSEKDATLTSLRWEGVRIDKARLCLLDIPGKFFAETLVIYPLLHYDCPIFGCEYLNIGGKKFFGAVDFHPVSRLTNYASRFLSEFPDTSKESSKFYDLEKYFSNKFWIKTQPTPFYYEEYLEVVKKYLEAYSTCLKSTLPLYLLDNYKSNSTAHQNYNSHMAEKDPARGILKAYFSEQFAEHYINNFLFTSR
jgi:hypothetical protein